MVTRLRCNGNIGDMKFINKERKRGQDYLDRSLG